MNQSTTVAIIVVVTFGAGFLVGRASVSTNEPAPPPAATAPAPEAQRPFPTAAPAPMAANPPAAAPAMPPMAAAGPMAAPPMMAAGSAEGAEPVTGALEETIQVPNFTYLRLKTSRGDEWAAVPTDTTLKNGDQVTVVKPMKMVNFTSKTLNRTFDSIWFGTLGK